VLPSKLFENVFTLSAHKLGNSNNFLKNKATRNHFIELIDEGVIHLDTADSYSNNQSERELAKILKVRPDLKITSKTGSPFLKLPNPIGKIMNDWKVTQKSRQIIFGNVSDFDPTLNPKNLKSRIGESLRRLEIESLDTYLLHHVPPQSRYDDFVDELIRIKQTGMTEKLESHCLTSDRPI